MSAILMDANVAKARKTQQVKILATKQPPTFREYRQLNDATMTPDKGFVKQLKMLDKEFEVVWDWGSSCWEIWKFPKELGKEPYHVTTVQTKNKGYRELGADILLNLQWGQPDRFTLDELVNYFDELDNQRRRRKMKAFRTKIEDITRETKVYVNTLLMQVPKSLSIERAVSND